MLANLRVPSPMSFVPKPRDFAGLPAATTHTITIALGNFDRRRGQTYNAFLGGIGGPQIVRNSTAVEYDACRALVARGLRGRLEVWRQGSQFASMTIASIAKAALLTVREDAHHGPDLVPYRPRPRVGDAARRRKRQSKLSYFASIKDGQDRSIPSNQEKESHP